MEYKKDDKIRLNSATVNLYMEYLIGEGMDSMARTLTEMVNPDVVITVAKDSSPSNKWGIASNVVNGSLEVYIKDQPWSSIPSALILPLTLLKRVKNEV